MIMKKESILKGSSINNAMFFGVLVATPSPTLYVIFSNPPPLKTFILSYLRHILIVLSDKQFCMMKMTPTWIDLDRLKSTRNCIDCYFIWHQDHKTYFFEVLSDLYILKFDYKTIPMCYKLQLLATFLVSKQNFFTMVIL